MQEKDALIGKELGQYRIEQLLGRGGMASVYLARQERINRVVAIKVLPAVFLQDEMFMKRFQREAELIARLEHVHILPVYDYGEEGSRPYLVMRYLDGGSVEDRIKQGPLPWGQVTRILAQVADALDYAHTRGAVHRDIKPANILLDAGGNAFLADFGIARMVEGTSQLTGSGLLGTPSYMSPEQGEGQTPESPSDIYALGISVYEMISGRLPYQADTPIGLLMAHINKPVPSLGEHYPGFPSTVDQVLQKALAKRPEDRYPTATAFARALAQAAEAAGGWQLDPGGTAMMAPPSPTPARVTPVPAEPAPVAVLPPQPQPAVPTVPGPVEAASGEATRQGVRAAHPAKAAQAKRGFGVVDAINIAGALTLAAVVLGMGFVWLTRGQELGAQGFAFGQGLTLPDVVATDLPAQPAEAETAASPDEAAEMPDSAAAVSAEAEPIPAPEEPQVTPTSLPAVLTLRGVEMLLVPAGSFTMGNDSGYPRERPARQVTLVDFYIDRTEVTNLYYQACVDEGGCAAPQFIDSPSQVSYYGREFYYEYPLIWATWYEADTYCRWRGGHLPLEAQWEKAARHNPQTGEDYLFPWGTNQLNEYYLNYASLFGQTREVTSYPQGASPVGALDMAGSLAEWTNDWYLDNYYEQAPSENPTGPTEGRFKVIRGGSYESQGSALTTTFRDYVDPRMQVATIGFRCAYTPSGDPTEGISTEIAQ